MCIESIHLKCNTSSLQRKGLKGIEFFVIDCVVMCSRITSKNENPISNASKVYNYQLTKFDIELQTNTNFLSDTLSKILRFVLYDNVCTKHNGV